MIIESAFFNMAMTLIREIEAPNEERIRGIMLEKLYEQYQVNYWDKANIFSQCIYPFARNKKADLLVCYGRLGNERLLKNFNITNHNWIEIKYINQQNKNRISNEIINDLLRLCLFVEENQGNGRAKGRYLIIICKKKKSTNIDFLKNFFIPQSKEITIHNKYFKIFKIWIQQYNISPSQFYHKPPSVEYCFSLCKIIKFQIGHKKSEILENNYYFSEQDTVLQKKFAQEYNNSLKN